MKVKAMKRNNYRNKIYVFSALSGLCLIGWGTRGDAQGVPEKAMETKVKIAAEKIVLSKALSELSQQSGIVIEAVSALEEREIALQFEDVTLRGALDALTQLHDWYWYSTDSGHLLIERKKAKAASEPSQISLLIQAALPSDWRHFLGVGRLVEKSVPTTGDAEQTIDARLQAAQEARTRMGVFRQKISRELLSSLNPEALTVTPLAFGKLSAAQQSLLTGQFLLAAFQETNHEVLLDNQALWKLDLQNNEVSLTKPASLQIGIFTKSPSGKPGFQGVIVRIPGQEERK